MFYIYGLIDSSTGNCFYVGKGCNRRMYTHAATVRNGRSTNNPHLDHKLTKLIKAGIPIEYTKFFDNVVDEDQAYLLEDQVIRDIGIEQLCNVWYGGQGGRIPTDEVRQRISQNRRGIPVSDETRSKLRKAKLGTVQSDDTKQKKSDATKGKPQTEQQRAANGRRSASLTGRQFSEEHKQKLRDAKLKNPTKYWSGKQLSVEHKQKISETLKERLNEQCTNG